MKVNFPGSGFEKRNVTKKNKTQIHIILVLEFLFSPNPVTLLSIALSKLQW